MLQNVKWGEYKVNNVFNVKNTKSILSRDIIQNSGTTPYLSAKSGNNSISSYIAYDEKLLDRGNCVFIGGKTFVVSYQKDDFYSNDSHNLALYLKDLTKETRRIQLFLTSIIDKGLGKLYHWGDSISFKKIQKDCISLPTNYSKINFAFMDSFISEIEKERILKLEAYLIENGLNDFTLTKKENKAIEIHNKLEWAFFNLEELFGKSTRGRRLKSDDRIKGILPFVTAGETDEGVSDFIGNDVIVFSENTTTIDMFGSAKYRNYKYGADDHIAVVHTQNLSKFASIFVTSSIHKTSYNGQFNYGRNFYSKDADELNILLPIKDDEPDYEIMETIISAIHKLVIKEVVLYVERKKEELNLN